MTAVAAQSPTLQPRTPSVRARYMIGISFFAVLAWSAYHPHDYFTWFLEVFPALIGFAILAATWHQFKFTTFIYGLVWAHAVILVVGGHYTYALMPVFEWLKESLNLSRNYYDRLGHFFQGLVPTMVARELLVRLEVVRKRKWLPFFLFCIAAAITVLYELLEWSVAAATGTRADDFLGTQGDVWDTQKDMAMCLAGSVFALLAFSRHHDRQMGAEK